MDIEVVSSRYVKRLKLKDHSKKPVLILEGEELKTKLEYQ